MKIIYPADSASKKELTLLWQENMRNELSHLFELESFEDAVKFASVIGALAIERKRKPEISIFEDSTVYLTIKAHGINLSDDDYGFAKEIENIAIAKRYLGLE